VAKEVRRGRRPGRPRALAPPRAGPLRSPSTGPPHSGPPRLRHPLHP
jgi:hypothetical protein